MPSPWISINDAVIFDGTGDVFLQDTILEFSAAEIKEMIALAMKHKNDEYLNACIYNDWRLNNFIAEEHENIHLGIGVPIKLYLKAKEKYERFIEQEDATRNAKQYHVKNRRREFQRIRSELYLAMIDRGDLHVCYVDGCEVVSNLTIDHIVPLSKGGTDELSNLRFACRPHNSKKGDRIDA